MDLSISVDGGTKELWTWLCKDPSLRSGLALRHQEVPDERMGAGLEIAAALAAVPALARAVFTYLAIRRRTRGSDLRITITTANGDVSSVEGDRIEDVEVLIRLMSGGKRDSHGEPATTEDGDATPRS